MNEDKFKVCVNRVEDYEFRAYSLSRWLRLWGKLKIHNFLFNAKCAGLQVQPGEEKKGSS